MEARNPSNGSLDWERSWAPHRLALPLLLAAAILAYQALPLYASREPDLVAFDDEEFVAYLDARIPGWMEEDGIPGASVLLIENSEVMWSGAYGYADLEAERPLTTASLMMAHSISKSVTAWGVMRLVEEGRVGLDDPVEPYLEKHLGGWRFPASPFAAEGVTVRRLLSHSAGVPLGALGVEYGPREPIPTLTETLTGDEVRLVREPGEAFAYSNAGYALLELLVEEVTGQHFEDYMREEVLAPLGMTHSTFAWREEMAAEVPTGYDLRGDPVYPYLYPYRASGGLFTTLDDVGRFVLAGLAPARGADHEVLLAPQSIEAMHTPQVPVPGLFGVVADGYGLGHFTETLPDGRSAVWHGGQGRGWMTHFHAVPTSGDGIVILTNSQRSWPFFGRILSGWSRRQGFGPVGMSRIVLARPAMHVLIGWVLLAALWIAWRVTQGVRTGSRRPTLRAGAAPGARIVAFIVAATLLGGLMWAENQEYLFISSIVPDDSIRFGAALLVLAIVLLAAAWLPVVDAPVSSTAIGPSIQRRPT
jgi:CubicO group peptidase (beta-lactamase class C family)